ncbi:MAG TPA: Hsp20/alpha crystallin family protein [Acholeplasmataceae bacterium]|nr:Hsp20/alpha crystallin family protein [Acholeplasmataceae bacterium]
MIKFYYDLKPSRNYMNSTVEVLDPEYVITVDLPGLKKEDIKVTLEEDILTITAKRTKEENKEYYLDERYYGELTRTFRLQDLKEDGEYKAIYENGVLTVRLPKLTEAETKKIITIE